MPNALDALCDELGAIDAQLLELIKRPRGRARQATCTRLEKASF